MMHYFSFNQVTAMMDNMHKKIAVKMHMIMLYNKPSIMRHQTPFHGVLLLKCFWVYQLLYGLISFHLNV